MYLVTQRAVFAWRARLSLLSGGSALLLSPIALALLEPMRLMGPSALALPLLLAATGPAAIILGWRARRAEPQARGIAALGIVFGVTGLLFMSCSLMMQVMMGIL